MLGPMLHQEVKPLNSPIVNFLAVPKIDSTCSETT